MNIYFSDYKDGYFVSDYDNCVAHARYERDWAGHHHINVYCLDLDKKRIDIAAIVFADSVHKASLPGDFEDEIPANAIPLNQTVRIIGKVYYNNYRKIDVFGLQTLGNVSATASHTVSQIEANCCEDIEVAVEAQFGANQDQYWNWYEFSDGVATTIADLENDLTDSQVPKNHTLLLFGKGDDYFGDPKINARLMLFADNID